MENPNFVFNVAEENIFLLQGPNDQPLTANLDRAHGELSLSLIDGSVRNFSLTSGGEPMLRALRISIDSTGSKVLEVGDVDFEEQPLFLQDYEINNPEVRDTWNLVGGHIGILDLRNIGKSISTRFDIDRVPVNLSITGIHLRVSTLRFDPGSDLTPWYEQNVTVAE